MAAQPGRLIITERSCSDRPLLTPTATSLRRCRCSCLLCALGYSFPPHLQSCYSRSAGACFASSFLVFDFLQNIYPPLADFLQAQLHINRQARKSHPPLVLASAIDAPHQRTSLCCSPDAKALVQAGTGPGSCSSDKPCLDPYGALCLLTSGCFFLPCNAKPGAEPISCSRALLPIPPTSSLRSLKRLPLPWCPCLLPSYPFPSVFVYTGVPPATQLFSLDHSIFSRTFIPSPLLQKPYSRGRAFRYH